MKPKDKKTFALIALLCSPFVWLGLHDARPWAGRPGIGIYNGILEVGCTKTQKTAGGDRLLPITSTTYNFQRNVGFSHTYRRDMTTYSAYLDMYQTATWNTYVIGSLKIERLDVTYTPRSLRAR